MGFVEMVSVKNKNRLQIFTDILNEEDSIVNAFLEKMTVILITSSCCCW